MTENQTLSHITSFVFIHKVTVAVLCLAAAFFLCTTTGLLSAQQLYVFKNMQWQSIIAAPWRFLSPVFLHHTPIHIITNLIIWVEFSRQIERVQGSARTTLLFVVLAITTSLVELFFVDYKFGGLSGVVIGFGAYIGVASFLQKNTWYFPLIYWLALAGIFLFDLSGSNTAKYVHASGFIIGVVLAVLFNIKHLKRVRT